MDVFKGHNFGISKNFVNCNHAITQSTMRGNVATAQSRPLGSRPGIERRAGLREVYKALKSCGWLLLETIEEVRQAERSLGELVYALVHPR